MAVSSVQLLSSGRSGNWVQGKRKYTAVYQVVTSDVNDGTFTVLSTPLLPIVGFTKYSAGNDIDLEAVCVSSTPNLVGGRKLWHVVCEFETPGEAERGVTEDGEETDDPLSWMFETEVHPVTITIPAVRARNLVAMPGRPIGTIGPATNSAGVVLDPTFERELSLEVITMRENRADFPHDEQALQDHINADAFVLRRFNYNRPVGIHSLRFDSLGGSVRFTNGLTYWHIVKQVTWHPLTWDVDQPDIGRLGVADEIPSGPVSPGDIEAGTAPLVVQRDDWGELVDEQILLDGQGRPLARGLPAVFLKYQIYEEAIMANKF